eukprot:285290_1
MSNSKKKSKKRTLSDSDSLLNSPNPKRRKISHPSPRSRAIANSTMEQDVEVSINKNTSNNGFTKTSKHNHNHNHHIANTECKERSPEPLLFMNDCDSNKTSANHFVGHQRDKRVSTPMGFNLSDNEIIGMVLEYLESAGYGQSAECLSRESGVERMTQTMDEEDLKQWVMNGDWMRLMQFYDSFAIESGNYLQSHRCSKYITATNLFYSKMLIIEQKFFELMAQNRRVLATAVLNDELIPLISPLHVRHDIESDQNMADIELIWSLIDGSAMRRTRHDDSDICMNSLYPRWRWNRVCSLLFVESSQCDALSRRKLYNELVGKLVQNNCDLLSIFDEFVKCQMLQRQHFNLRCSSIALCSQMRMNGDDEIAIPSTTHYILNGHSDQITHLSFDCSGEWLISSSNDKRTLIWDFGDVLMSELNGDILIPVICDILHYFAVTYHALSPDREYLMTMSEYSHSFDDFKHDRDAQCRHFGELNGDNQVQMETERGCNIYLWKLTHCGGHKLIRQYQSYRVSASVCWCPDSAYYFITSFGCDIDLYSVQSGLLVSTLASYGNLMTDLRLSHSGYRLCVTLNGRDIRIYYSCLGLKPWLHFSDAHHTINISSLISDDGDDNKSLASLDDKLWIFYEEELDLDKKTHGQMHHNDCIVSSAVSEEYLLVLTTHPILLLIDLRLHTHNPKFFYGLKQNRFKLQCGFGGYSLPPLASTNRVATTQPHAVNKMYEPIESQPVPRNMIAHMLQICCKYPSFLPTRMQQKNEENIASLLVSLPAPILHKLYEFMKSKVLQQHTTNQCKEIADVRRQLLEFEVLQQHQSSEFKKANVTKLLKQMSPNHCDDQDEPNLKIIQMNHALDNTNCSVNELHSNQSKDIANLRSKKKHKKRKNNNSLIHSEYIDNDYFGGHHFIICGSEDGNVCIWNRCTQKIIKLAGHTKSVNCVVWNPKDSFILVSGADDAQIRVWGPKTKQKH